MEFQPVLNFIYPIGVCKFPIYLTTKTSIADMTLQIKNDLWLISMIALLHNDIVDLRIFSTENENLGIQSLSRQNGGTLQSIPLHTAFVPWDV